MHRRLPRWMLLTVATGMGFGYSPIVPGTVGSLWGLLWVWALQQTALPPLGRAAVAVAVALLGIPLCTAASRHFDRHDPREVVLDEIVAFPFVFYGVAITLQTGIVGFFWFRLFDTVKPWPIRRLEQLPEGLGIVVDDLMAALYAAVALWLTLRCTPLG